MIISTTFGDQSVIIQWSLVLLLVINEFLYVMVGNIYKITMHVFMSLVINARSFGHHSNYALHSRDELHMTTDH